MKMKQRVVIDLDVEVADTPQGVGQYETLEKVGRLAHIIAADNNSLIEIYKNQFFDLLIGNYYDKEIQKFTKPKGERELILSVARKMPAQDSKFFKQVLSKSKRSEGDTDKDDVVNLIYSQFGSAEITNIYFEPV